MTKVELALPSIANPDTAIQKSAVFRASAKRTPAGVGMPRNHWGTDVASAADVERIWNAAHQLGPTYGIRCLCAPCLVQTAAIVNIARMCNDAWRAKAPYRAATRAQRYITLLA